MPRPSSSSKGDGKAIGHKGKKKKPAAKVRKHPLAPKKPRSAFILFSQRMHNEKKSGAAAMEKDEKGDQLVVPSAKIHAPEAAKRHSVMWKAMPPEERKKWNDMADNDKKRYKLEKTIHLGPLTSLHEGKRPKKDESAPKRPMSAFLDYSKTMRSFAIRANPDVTDNKKISVILGDMWKKASDEEKKPIIERELKMRADYKEKIKQWRNERDEQIAEERRKREVVVQDAIDNGTSEELIEAARVSRTLAESAAREAAAQPNLRGRTTGYLASSSENAATYHSLREHNRHPYTAEQSSRYMTAYPKGHMESNQSRMDHEAYYQPYPNADQPVSHLAYGSDHHHNSHADHSSAAHAQPSYNTFVDQPFAGIRYPSYDYQNPYLHSSYPGEYHMAPHYPCAAYNDRYMRDDSKHDVHPLATPHYQHPQAHIDGTSNELNIRSHPHSDPQMSFYPVAVEPNTANTNGRWNYHRDDWHNYGP